MFLIFMVQYTCMYIIHTHERGKHKNNLNHVCCILFVQYIYISMKIIIYPLLKNRNNLNQGFPSMFLHFLSRQAFVSLPWSFCRCPYGENLGTHWRKVTPEILREMENKWRKNREQIM